MATKRGESEDPSVKKLVELILDLSIADQTALRQWCDAVIAEGLRQRLDAAVTLRTGPAALHERRN